MDQECEEPAEWAAIELELEARAKLEARVGYVDVPGEVVEEYAKGLRKIGALRSGRKTSLYGRLSPRGQRRLDTIAYLESQLLASDGDYSQVIFLGCQLLEGELGRFLQEPSARAAPLLIEGVGAQPAIANVVARWLDRELPTTLGTLHSVLVAWRLALNNPSDAAKTLLANSFESDYQVIVETRGFERSLGNIRYVFDEMARGLRMQELEDMELVASMVLGCVSFSGWIAEGPPEPMPSMIGILHHHLTLSREGSGLTQPDSCR